MSVRFVALHQGYSLPSGLKGDWLSDYLEQERHIGSPSEAVGQAPAALPPDFLFSWASHEQWLTPLA